MAEPRGRFLYDMVMAEVSGQIADVAALVGRAKDLIGAATIASTITGALANDKLTEVTKHDYGWVTVLALIGGLGLVYVLGFLALRPRSWSFVPNAALVREAVANDPAAQVDIYYAQVAAGFLAPGQVAAGTSAIEHNRRQIRTLSQLVVGQIIGLALLAGAALWLALRAT